MLNSEEAKGRGRGNSIAPSLFSLPKFRYCVSFRLADISVSTASVTVAEPYLEEYCEPFHR